MQVTETTMLEYLRCPVQYTIPIYYRSYLWSVRHWSKLWEDVLQVGLADSGAEHPLGILYTQKRQLSYPEHQVILIDGMQRLVTTILLMAALWSAIESDGGENSASLLCLGRPGWLRGKLLLNGRDDDALRRIFEKLPQTTECSGRIFDAFRFYLGQVSQLDREGRAAICRGLTRLPVLEVVLDCDGDELQKIYTSVNYGTH